MKKILLLVSFLAIGMYTNNQVKAKEEKSDVAEVENVTSVSEIAEINQIESGGETTALPTKKQKAQRSTETKTFELKRYFAQIKDGSSGTELVPMPNVDFKISYKLNGKDVFFYENGRTNEKGEVLDIPAVEIPAEVNSIRVWYYLGNEERGYIQKYNKTKYCFIVTQNIPTESVSINYWCNFWIGSTTDQDTAFYNFQAARQNYYFDRAVKEFQEIIKKTNNLFPDTVSFEVAPINVNFEKENSRIKETVSGVMVMIILRPQILLFAIKAIRISLKAVLNIILCTSGRIGIHTEKRKWEWGKRQLALLFEIVIEKVGHI